MSDEPEPDLTEHLKNFREPPEPHPCREVVRDGIRIRVFSAMLITPHPAPGVNFIAVPLDKQYGVGVWGVGETEEAAIQDLLAFIREPDPE